MTHCSCSFCQDCFIHHFSSVIKEKSIIHVKCPICNNPQNEDEFMEFFNLLDTQIRHYLDEETHCLFQRKLRDAALMKMPNFRWCSHCQFGILHEGESLEMECPECEKSTCFQCKEKWDGRHVGLSCEQFQKLKMKEDENLNTYLAKNGIVCPACKYQYDLWKGGCLHFTCRECKHEFCGGCKQPFYKSSECGFSEDCGNKGLHAHHRRDCFYYLRDWDVERLQKLLQHNKIQYAFKERNNTNNEPKRVFIAVKFLQTSDKDEKNQDHSATSTEEKEYLVEQINTNKLDPLDLFTEEEMIIELQRWKVTIPKTCYGEKYLHTLQEKIKKEIPLFGNLDTQANSS
ncbi:hypothetical protein GDO81_011299 [Engystomops pustulosus]|uniref:RING-type domain-containing protein n=2 Tax=Engystomops pustulosus TaxID=76066 RepID=A0AAV7BDB8_ENGPU|nr:hypothetical protein GDO81_011299 [Engystomops pustulosus]